VLSNNNNKLGPFSQGNIPIWLKAACQQILLERFGFFQPLIFVYMPQKKDRIKFDLFPRDLGAVTKKA
jgi:hypothetical protein